MSEYVQHRKLILLAAARAEWINAELADLIDGIANLTREIARIEAALSDDEKDALWTMIGDLD